MRVLVFGSRGWIGQQFINNTSHHIIEATTRPENYQEALDIKPKSRYRRRLLWRELL